MRLRSFTLILMPAYAVNMLGRKNPREHVQAFPQFKRRHEVGVYTALSLSASGIRLFNGCNQDLTVERWKCQQGSCGQKSKEITQRFAAERMKAAAAKGFMKQSQGLKNLLRIRMKLILNHVT